VPSDRWVPSPRPRPRAPLRLFCLPHAGGGASLFRHWAHALPEWIELRPIQLPGREDRLSEPPFTDLRAAVHALAEALAPHLDRPFALFGHSMGALLAFELARRLRRHAGSGPTHLLVAAHGAPQVPDPRPPIHHLPEPDFLERLRALQGTPEEVLQDDELRALFLPILRADFALCESYAYTSREPLDCPITALGGLQDREVTRKALSAWAAHTIAGFRLRMLPGDHFFLQSARSELLRAIEEALSA
jgi:medium-chain acyl-[acyl-carrier-protein] hydrolase